MKKILIFFFASLLVLSSCEDVVTPDLGLEGNQWIQFGKASYSGNEADGTIQIPVMLAADSNPADLEVNFTVLSASIPDGYTIEPANGIVTIPAGEFVAYVEITPVDNSGTNDNIVIKLGLNENMSYPLGLAGQELRLVETKVTILDDDCPLDLTEFYGTYVAKEYGYCDGCYEVTISAGPVAGTLLVSNLYETGGTTVIELDNSDPSRPFVKYRSKEFGAAFNVSATYGDVWATTTADPYVSTFRTCDQFMDLTYKQCVSVGCFSAAYNVHIELTKK